VQEISTIHNRMQNIKIVRFDVLMARNNERPVLPGYDPV
jgi:hypothetical protein